LTPDEIIGNKLIELPPKLKQHPYLQEFYGTECIYRSIRAIFDRYLGWFSGKTSDLNVDSPKIRAENLIQLGGGTKQVFEKAQLALKEEKYQWALELIEALTLFNEDLNLAELNEFHSLILEKLASLEISANGRNWYLTKSLEVKGLIQIKPSEKQTIETVFKSSIKNYLKFLSVNFNYQKAKEQNLLIFFHFNDTNEKYTIKIRNSVVDMQDDWNDKMLPNLIIEIKTENIW
ncbi:unnamed protein product, partial [Adineta steineri]